MATQEQYDELREYLQEVADEASYARVIVQDTRPATGAVDIWQQTLEVVDDVERSLREINRFFNWNPLPNVTDDDIEHWVLVVGADRAILRQYIRALERLLLKASEPVGPRPRPTQAVPDSNDGQPISSRGRPYPNNGPHANFKLPGHGGQLGFGLGQMKGGGGGIGGSSSGTGNGSGPGQGDQYNQSDFGNGFGGGQGINGDGVGSGVGSGLGLGPETGPDLGPETGPGPDLGPETGPAPGPEPGSGPAPGPETPDVITGADPKADPPPPPDPTSPPGSGESPPSTDDPDPGREGPPGSGSSPGGSPNPDDGSDETPRMHGLHRYVRRHADRFTNKGYAPAQASAVYRLLAYSSGNLFDDGGGVNPRFFGDDPSGASGTSRGGRAADPDGVADVSGGIGGPDIGFGDTPGGPGSGVGGPGADGGDWSGGSGSPDIGNIASGNPTGPDPDNEWGAGGYNPHYQPSGGYSWTPYSRSGLGTTRASPAVTSARARVSSVVLVRK